MKSIKKMIRLCCAAMIAATFASHAHAAAPLANAGTDHVVADYDGNASVIVRLNASASTDADGDIVSYTWTWPGSSANGLTPEVIFPASNSPVTVTLTVTDAMGNSSTDSLVVSAYEKETALFKDFVNEGPYPSTNATIAGETLVLNTPQGLDGIYRRNAGVWTETPTTGFSYDHLAVDANTVFGGSFYNGTEFRVLRHIGNEWIASALTHPTPILPASGDFQQLGFAVDAQSFVVTDRYNSFHAQTAGRVFVYDWAGDHLNFATEILPPGGLVAGDEWGKKIAVEGDMMVVASNLPSGFGDELHVFRKIAGSWMFEANLTADILNPYYLDPVSTNYLIAFNISIGNGKILIARFTPFQMLVIEKIGPNWVQTPIAGNEFTQTQGMSYEMNDDGLSFVVNDEAGKFLLYKKGAEASTWAGSSVSSRRLLTRDLTPTRDTKVTGFSNGLIAISDSVIGKARVIDSLTSIHPINVEPVANAGADITTTSFDGGPVRVFLNGGASKDLNYSSPLSAVWSWQGGSANGLQTFANIPPSVTTIELTITDIGGLISRDTINLNIESPPVIDAGPDVTVVDANADGSIQLMVNGTVVSQDNPIVSWNWRWPGGTLNSQSGRITLGAEANGNPITLEVVDSHGLFSQDEFIFRISNANPHPSILLPVDGAALDRFGNHVAIQNDTALIAAPGVRIDGETIGATYLSENINNAWQQLSLAPGTEQGSGVLIDGDTAFIAAENLSLGGFNEVGGVFVYQRQSGVWNQTGLITSPDPLSYNASEYLRFGASMAKSGNWMVIGAPGAHGGFSRQGAAYLFEHVSGTWTFRQKLFSPSAENFGSFGYALAISGESLVITSQLYQDSYDSGVAHVFTKGPTQWTFTLTLEDDQAAGQSVGFGRSAAMTDSEILIGAQAEYNGADPLGYARGVVYRYSRNGGTWTQTGKLIPTVVNPYANGSFGTSLFLRDGLLLVGAPLDAGFLLGTNTRIGGRVHVYKMGATDWEFIDDIHVSNLVDPQANNTNGWFGFSASHDGKDLIVGAPSPSGPGAGRVYIFQDYAALVPNANHEPLAHAGADIEATDTIVRDPGSNEIIEPLGSELVNLSAAASTDRENAIVSHEWTWPGGSASGASSSARFPVGSTLVTLTVKDSGNVMHTDTVLITISLPQSVPANLSASAGNSLTLDLFSSLSKWRLSSEFLWHGDNESTSGVVEGATYQVEVLPYPGSTEIVSTFVTTTGSATTEFIDLELSDPPSGTGSISFPETSQGFSWRLVGESVWRHVADDGDAFAEDIEFVLPAVPLRIEFKPVAGFTTPQTRVVNVIENSLTALDWAEYLRINSYDPAKTFDLATTPDLAASPYRYVGMIRSALGRGTGTVVADRVVLTAAHLFFDANGLQWSDTQWFSRQQQGTRQAPPITPRGVLYQTSYAKLIAPDSVEGTVANLPEDPQQVDFAVLYFADETIWDQGSANFLQSTPAKNWLTGSENKHAVGYPQRSQAYENRGMMFQKQFPTPLQSLGTGLYETTEVFGDGGASGSALFVQPAGGGNFYPAAILLAGQGRAVYRVIDEDITRMIKDGEDAATGNDDVLNGDSSLLTFDGLGAFTTVGVQVFPAGIRTKSRWTITPVKGAASANMVTTKQVAFNEKWSSYTISFAAISGYNTPAPLKVLNGAVLRNTANIHPFTYTAIVRTTPTSPLDQWKEANNITNLLDDADHDGMSELIEYALDRNPGASDSMPPIKVSQFPYQTTFAEFEVYVSSAAEGIFYHVKASNTPDRANAVTLDTFTSADGPSAYLTVTDTQPIAASPTRFAWVEIEVPSDP